MVNGLQEEWEIELEKLTSKFEKELSKKRNKEDYKNLTIKHSQVSLTAPFKWLHWKVMP